MGAACDTICSRQQTMNQIQPNTRKTKSRTHQFALSTHSNETTHITDIIQSDILVYGYLRQYLEHIYSIQIPNEIKLLCFQYWFIAIQTIVCGIGANHGQFGNGNTSNLYKLTELEWSKNMNITQIWNGRFFSFFKDMNNKLYCAGENEGGQCLIDPNKEWRIYTLQLMNALQNKRVKQIFCNICASHAFILCENGSIYGFGRNRVSQLGIGSDDKYKYELCNIEWKYGKIKDIKCAQFYSIILGQNGYVYSTDYSLYGGNGQRPINRNGSKKWTKIRELRNITHIATGESHTLCIDMNESVYSFGFNGYGQLGINKIDSDTHSQPLPIPFFKERNIKIHQICCGGNYSVILSNTEGIYTFGRNENGECGHGYASKEPLLIPTQIQALKDEKIKQIQSGKSHSSLMTQTNKIYMFGDNKEKQCIITSYNPKTHHPVTINEYIQYKLGKKIISITLGYWNTNLLVITLEP